MNKKQRTLLWEHVESIAKVRGVLHSTFRTWKKRGFVPPRWWHDMEISSRGKLTRDDLWELWNEQQGKK